MSGFILAIFVLGVLIIVFKKPKSALNNQSVDSVPSELNNDHGIEATEYSLFQNEVQLASEAKPVEISTNEVVSSDSDDLSKQKRNNVKSAEILVDVELNTEASNNDSLSALITNLQKQSEEKITIFSCEEIVKEALNNELLVEATLLNDISRVSDYLEIDAGVEPEMPSVSIDDSVIDISNEGIDIEIDSEVDDEKESIYNKVSEFKELVSKIASSLQFSTKIESSEIVDPNPSERYTGFTTPDYSNRSYYTDFSLSKKLSKQLTLTKEQSNWLDQILYYDTVFLNINGCLSATAKTYLSVVEKINDIYVKEGSSLSLVLKEFAQKISRGKVYEYTYYNYEAQVVNNLYLNIFKKTEQAVRQFYRHKRAVNTVFYYPELEDEYSSLYGDLVDNLLKDCIIDVPDKITQVELNKNNTTRWKFEFDEIEKKLIDNDADVSLAVKQIKNLAKLNKKNPNLENIYFEASKMLSKYERQEAVKMYLFYIHTDLKSNKIDNKQLTKTVQKSLFKNADELEVFETIVLGLINHRDIRKANALVKTIYIPKRKKIELSRNEINEVTKQHSETVILLNEILGEEDEQEYSAVHLEEKNEEELTLKITSSHKASDARFNKVQLELLEKFAENEFILEQDIVGHFALEKGLFKNQLIDQINDLVYDELDDVLIEEEEENYIILPQTYKKVIYEN